MEGDAEIIMQNMGYTRNEQNTMLQLLEQVTANDYFSPDQQIALFNQWAKAGTPKEEQIVSFQIFSLGYTGPELETMLQELSMLGYTRENQFKMLHQWVNEGKVLHEHIKMLKRPQLSWGADTGVKQNSLTSPFHPGWDPRRPES